MQQFQVAAAGVAKRGKVKELFVGYYKSCINACQCQYHHITDQANCLVNRLLDGPLLQPITNHQRRRIAINYSRICLGSRPPLFPSHPGVTAIPAACPRETLFFFFTRLPLSSSSSIFHCQCLLAALPRLPSTAYVFFSLESLPINAGVWSSQIRSPTGRSPHVHHLHARHQPKSALTFTPWPSKLNFIASLHPRSLCAPIGFFAAGTAFKEAFHILQRSSRAAFVCLSLRRRSGYIQAAVGRLAPLVCLRLML